jgi:hypothetical protein
MEEERGFEDEDALDLYFSDTKQSRIEIYGIDDTKVIRRGKAQNTNCIVLICKRR